MDRTEKLWFKLSIAFILLSWVYKIYWTLLAAGDFSEFESNPTSFFGNVALSGFISLGLVVIFTYMSGDSLKSLGFKRYRFNYFLGLGILFGIGLYLFNSFVVSPIFRSFLPDNSIDMRVLFADSSYLPLWILIAIFKGGFQEEIWRIFILTRFEKLFGNVGLWLALVLSSSVFGLTHLYQGWDSVLAIGFLGFLMGLLYLKYRMAWVPVIAHAVFDLIAVGLAFSIYN